MQKQDQPTKKTEPQRTLEDAEEAWRVLNYGNFGNHGNYGNAITFLCESCLLLLFFSLCAPLDNPDNRSPSPMRLPRRCTICSPPSGTMTCSSVRSRRQS